MTRRRLPPAVLLAVGWALAAVVGCEPLPEPSPPPALAPESPTSPPLPQPTTPMPTQQPSATPAATATSAPTAEPTATATGSPPPNEPATPTPTPGAACDPAVLDQEPTAPFDLLGIVEVESRRPGSPGSNPLAAAKLQACALGGDALVVLYRNERTPGSSSVIDGSSGTLPRPEIRVAVIRYRRP